MFGCVVYAIKWLRQNVNRINTQTHSHSLPHRDGRAEQSDNFLQSGIIYLNTFVSAEYALKQTVVRTRAIQSIRPHLMH